MSFSERREARNTENSFDFAVFMFVCTTIDMKKELLIDVAKAAAVSRYEKTSDDDDGVIITFASSEWYDYVEGTTFCLQFPLENEQGLPK